MLTFCTLFDSNYLDKGLVLYESLKNVMTDFKLYILAMDDICCSILNAQQLEHVVVISLKEFEDEELLELLLFEEFELFELPDDGASQVSNIHN